MSNNGPFIIIHKERGEALCDEHQFPEFAKAGWKKKSEKKAKASNEEKPAEPAEPEPTEVTDPENPAE